MLSWLLLNSFRSVFEAQRRFVSNISSKSAQKALKLVSIPISSANNLETAQKKLEIAQKWLGNNIPFFVVVFEVI